MIPQKMNSPKIHISTRKKIEMKQETKTISAIFKK